MNDDLLMDRLREIAGVADAAPALVHAAASAAFALRDLDASLAELVRDSAESSLAAVRGDGDDRLLSFESGDVTVEMQVTENGPRRDVVAHVSGAALADATVDMLGASRSVSTDDGVLVVRDLPPGPLRLRLTTTAGAAVATSWVRI